MAIFNNFEGIETGSGDSQYGNDALLGIRDFLSYQECRDIYRFFPVGKRIASALPNFALSAPRVIVFNEMPPMCESEFNELQEKMQIQKLVKNVTTYARVFGVSGLFLACEGEALDTQLNVDIIQKRRIAITLQDPFTMQGLQINQDASSPDYQKPVSVHIQGKPVHPSRVCVLFNDLPFYLQWMPSTYSFGSASVYQNMVSLIKSWNRCYIALERLATKSSAIVFKNRDGGLLSGITAKAAKKSLELIRDLQNDGAASIAREDSIETLPLSGVDAVDRIISQMNQAILMALNDTPSAILLDKELAQGFGNGSEDMKAILMAVDSFRDTQLYPIYNFVDKILLYKMCDKDFLDRLRKEDRELALLSDIELRERVINAYSFEYGNLYPETEATRLDNSSRKLDNLAKLRTLGANLENIANIINNDKDLYQEEIQLDSEVGDDNDEIYSSFDFSENSHNQDIEAPEVADAPETRQEINQDKQ